MDSGVGIVSKCILAPTLPASSCTDAQRTLLRALVLTSHEFLPLEDRIKEVSSTTGGQAED